MQFANANLISYIAFYDTICTNYYTGLPANTVLFDIIESLTTLADKQQAIQLNIILVNDGSTTSVRLQTVLQFLKRLKMLF